MMKTGERWREMVICGGDGDWWRKMMRGGDWWRMMMRDGDCWRKMMRNGDWC